MAWEGPGGYHVGVSNMQTQEKTMGEGGSGWTWTGTQVVGIMKIGGAQQEAEASTFYYFGRRRRGCRDTNMDSSAGEDDTMT